MRKIALLLIPVAAFSAGAIAAETMVHQKGRVFSMEEVTIAKGDSLTFVNDDSVPHNIMSISPGNEFDLGSMKPGTATPVAFGSAGEATGFRSPPAHRDCAPTASRPRDHGDSSFATGSSSADAAWLANGHSLGW